MNYVIRHQITVKWDSQAAQWHLPIIKLIDEPSRSSSNCLPKSIKFVLSNLKYSTGFLDIKFVISSQLVHVLMSNWCLNGVKFIELGVRGNLSYYYAITRFLDRYHDYSAVLCLFVSICVGMPHQCQSIRWRNLITVEIKIEWDITFLKFRNSN